MELLICHQIKLPRNSNSCLQDNPKLSHHKNNNPLQHANTNYMIKEIEHEKLKSNQETLIDKDDCEAIAVHLNNIGIFFCL